MNREAEEELVMMEEAKTEDNEVRVLVKAEDEDDEAEDECEGTEDEDDEAVAPVEAEIGSTILNILLENAGLCTPG